MMSSLQLSRKTICTIWKANFDFSTTGLPQQEWWGHVRPLLFSAVPMMSTCMPTMRSTMTYHGTSSPLEDGPHVPPTQEPMQSPQQLVPSLQQEIMQRIKTMLLTMLSAYMLLLTMRQRDGAPSRLVGSRTLDRQQRDSLSNGSFVGGG